MAVDRDKVLQAAQKLVEKKRYDKAVVEYQKLVADDPKDVRTLLKIGDLFLKMEQHVDAITTYERVGQFYSAQGFALKAIDMLTCADDVATATISAGHAYLPEQVIEIAGADQPEYNGEVRVIAATATSPRPSAAIVVPPPHAPSRTSAYPSSGVPSRYSRAMYIVCSTPSHTDPPICSDPPSSPVNHTRSWPSIASPVADTWPYSPPAG